MPTQYNFKPRRQTWGEPLKQQILRELPWKRDLRSMLMERPVHGVNVPILPGSSAGLTSQDRRRAWIAAGSPNPYKTGVHELIHVADPLAANRKGHTRDISELISAYIQMFPERFTPQEEPLTGDMLSLLAPKYRPPQNRGIPFPTEGLIGWVLKNYPKSRRAEEFVTEAIARHGKKYQPTREVYNYLFE